MTVELDRLEALEDLAKLSSSDKFHELRIRALEVIPRDAESLEKFQKNCDPEFIVQLTDALRVVDFKAVDGFQSLSSDVSYWEDEFEYAQDQVNRLEWLVKDLLPIVKGALSEKELTELRIAHGLVSHTLE